MNYHSPSLEATDIPLASLLDASDPRLLLATVVYATGNPRWLDSTYLEASAGEGSSEALLEIKSAAAEIMSRASESAPSDYRDLPDETLNKLADLVCGEPIGHEYLPKLRQELQPASTRTDAPISASQPRTPRIAVIGAGPAGIYLASGLQRAGFEFTVFEKNSAIGGVWWDNTYPGCGVDTPGPLYTFPNSPNPKWARHYPDRDEILSYLTRYAINQKIQEAILTNHEVTRLEYNSMAYCWEVFLEGPNGAPIESMQFDVVVTCTGILNRPKLPAIPGLDDFQGCSFHTAEWDNSADFSGTVALIGNGSSGVQVGRWIASEARELLAFQRTPHWIAPKTNYHAPVSEEEQQLLARLPLYARWRRFQLYWLTGDACYKYYEIDPSWTGPDANKPGAELRRELTSYIESQLGHRSDLLRQLVPSYPPYTKRMVVDNNWYRTLTRDNVRLITDRIERITPTGIVTEGGREHHVDTVVFATGFHDSRFLYPMTIVGRCGATFETTFGSNENVRSYLGVTTPGFPNLFSIMGPNSAIVGGSNLFTVECQANYIIDCLRAMRNQGIAAIECKADVCRDYNERLDAKMVEMVWSLPEAGARYLNSSGRVVINHPWRFQDYWLATQRARMDDFVLSYRMDSIQRQDG